MNRPRGICPVCKRELALRADRSLPFHYGNRRRRQAESAGECAGSYQQPTDQGRLLEGSP